MIRNACSCPAVTFILMGSLFALPSVTLAKAAKSVPLPHADATITACEVGLGRVVKLGHWTPVWVEFAGGPQAIVGSVEAVATDDDHVPVTVQERIRIPPGETTRALFYTKFGRPNASLVVNVTASSKRLATKQFAMLRRDGPDALANVLPAHSTLVVAMGSSNLGLSKALVTSNRVDRRNSVTTLDSADHLPDKWYGYDAADQLVISARGDGFLADMPADDPRLVAIRRWVELGGRLILLCGADAERFIGPDRPLAQFIPGQFTDMVLLDRTGAIEQYAGSDTPIEFDDPSQRLAVPRLTEVSGRVDAYEGSGPDDLPIIVRAPFGFGEVTFAGIDLDRRLLAEWSGRTALLRRLLDIDDSFDDQRANQSFALTKRGYSDLSGALRDRLGRGFGGTRTIPFAWVTALVIGYLVLIGPGDYFLVKNVFRRMAWTWVTFPTLILLVSGGAYAYITSQKGRSLCVNQIELVDFDTIRGITRGTLWSCLYSPSTASYDVALSPASPAGGNEDIPPGLVSWTGLAGSGLGGMHAAGQMTTSSVGYDVDTRHGEIRDLPIPIWSTKTLTSCWHAPTAPEMPTDLVATGDGLLTGTIINRCGADLKQVQLLYGTWAWRLGEMADGDTVRIDRMLDPLRVRTLLRASHSRGPAQQGRGGGPTAFTRQPFSVEQASTRQLLNLAMFYDALGGYRFAGLWNRYSPVCDLSRQLVLDRAVLVANRTEGGSRLMIDKQPLHRNDHDMTVYRFLLPVDSSKE